MVKGVKMTKAVAFEAKGRVKRGECFTLSEQLSRCPPKPRGASLLRRADIIAASG
jgi:hypothetical protein